MKKIGEIKGIPVVEGNVNEVTRNQIHYKEDSGNIQLSKRGNDNKLNNVTGSSSSGDGGVKEYYYKVLNEQAYEVIKEFPFILISGIIADKRYEYPYIPQDDINFLAFRIVDIQMSYWAYIDYNKVDRGVILKGDLYERFALGISTSGGGTVSVEDVKNQFGTMIQEITKEEYESMITYKPE